ncbi:uncharacterized protein LOC122799665 [Protopterus annectens]|uniref:uncharacterized protein LOC122799665 n=1 Tax=Protopterus annectens TaxID=7888 RepID=UPI001CF9D60A|nr:uncharacterized protein LOC122799665 [Protopterus annectens]
MFQKKNNTNPFLQVAEAKPVTIQSEVMQKELESCIRREYTAESLPLLLHQFFTERINQLVQSKYLHMLRWKRFCQHTSVSEQLYPFYKKHVGYIMQEYNDALQRAQRLSAARERFLTGHGDASSMVTVQDLVIYLQWLVCHLHSVKTIHSYLRVLQYLPLTDRMKVSIQGLHEDVQKGGDESSIVSVAETSMSFTHISMHPSTAFSSISESAGNFVSVSLPSARLHTARSTANSLAVNHMKGHLSCDDTCALPSHRLENDKFTPQLQQLISYFGISYDVEDLRNTANEMELFAMVGHVFRSIFNKQQTMKKFPAYDSGFTGSEKWGAKDPSMALKKEANWIPFLKIKPKKDPWQQKLMTKLQQEKKVDELLRLQSQFMQVSDPDQAMGALREHGVAVFEPYPIQSFAVTSHQFGQQTNEIWKNIYGIGVVNQEKKINGSTKTSHTSDSEPVNVRKSPSTPRKRKDDGIVPKGLRHHQFPTGLVPDSAFHQELLVLFDRQGFELIECIVKHYSIWVEDLNKQVAELDAKIKLDNDFTRYKYEYSRIFTSIDQYLVKLKNNKAKKLERDTIVYKEGKGYPLPPIAQVWKTVSEGSSIPGYNNQPTVFHYTNKLPDTMVQVNEDVNQTERQGYTEVRRSERLANINNQRSDMVDFFSKGNTYVPKQNCDLVRTIIDLKTFTRKLNFNLMMGSNVTTVQDDQFRIPSTFNPPLHPLISVFEQMCELDIRFNVKHRGKIHTKDRTLQKEKGFLEFIKLHDIRVCKPDKGGGLVIFDNMDYYNRMIDLLDDPAYEVSSRSETNHAYSVIKDSILDMFIEGRIEQNIFSYMSTQFPRFSYVATLQLLGLDEGKEENTDNPVLMRGAYLSFLYLRHLKIRELQRRCLGILNYFRSVERTLTIITSGLIMSGGDIEAIAEDTCYVNAARGGAGVAGGLGSHHYLHNTPADFKVHSVEFMEFSEVENHDDFYTEDDGSIHTQDQQGNYIVYDVAVTDLMELEKQLLLVATHYIEKDKGKFLGSEPISGSHEADINLHGWAHLDVDRFAVLLDLWTCEAEFLQNKNQLLDSYFESFQHVTDSEGRFSLAQIIIDIMHKRPRFDLESEYFVSTYESECICLQLHLQLIRDVLSKQIDEQREYIQMIWRDGQQGSAHEFGLPPNIIPKQLISLNNSSSALRNIYFLEFHPSLSLAALIPKALDHIYTELYHVHRPATATEAISLEKQVLQLAKEKWMTLEIDGSSYSSQIQKDLFADTFMKNPYLVKNIGISLLESLEDSGNTSAKEKQTLVLETFSKLLEIVTLRHRLIETASETALLARLYKTCAVEMGFEEYHLYLRPVQFEFASHKEEAEQLPPVFITALLEDDSSIDRYIPSSLLLGIQEIDELQIGKFSFRTWETVLQLLSKSGVDNLQVALACQVVQKNALIAAVQQATFCHSNFTTAVHKAHNRHHAKEGPSSSSRIQGSSARAVLSRLGNETESHPFIATVATFSSRESGHQEVETMKSHTMDNPSIELDFAPEKTDQRRRWETVMDVRDNPFLAMELFVTSPNVEATNSDNLHEFNVSIKELENMLYKLQRLTWQRRHLEACLHFKIVPRGMRVLCMPTYGDSHPDLLKRWQQLNLELSYNYIRLLLDYFSPIEKELSTKAEELYNTTHEKFKGAMYKQRIESLLNQTCSYGERLQQTKMRKLQRDYFDFTNSQVFLWPRSRNVRETGLAATTDNDVFNTEASASTTGQRDTTALNDVPTTQGVMTSSVRASTTPTMDTDCTPPPNQLALLRSTTNNTGAKPKIAQTHIERFLPLPVQSQYGTRGRTPEAFISIQLEKLGLRDVMLNEFIHKRQTMGTLMKNLEEVEKIKRELILSYCQKFSFRMSQYSLRGQIIAYYNSLRTLLSDFPSIRDTYFMIGVSQEKKGDIDSKLGLHPDPRKLQQRPRCLLSADGETFLNLWFIPDQSELLIMFKTLDEKELTAVIEKLKKVHCEGKCEASGERDSGPTDTQMDLYTLHSPGSISPGSIAPGQRSVNPASYSGVVSGAQRNQEVVFTSEPASPIAVQSTSRRQDLSAWFETPDFEATTEVFGATWNRDMDKSSHLPSLKEQISQYEKLSRKYRAMQLDNLFLIKSRGLNQVPKGLRLWKLPMGVEMDSDIFQDLVELFQKAGMELLDLIIRNNNNRLNVLREGISKLHFSITSDLLFLQYKVNFEKVFKNIEAFVEKNRAIKHKKLARDAADYKNKAAYPPGRKVFNFNGTNHEKDIGGDDMDVTQELYVEEGDDFLEPQVFLRRSERLLNKQPQTAKSPRQHPRRRRSNHSVHQKQGVVKSQFIHISRLTSNEQSCIQEFEVLKSMFLERGYLPHIIDEAWETVIQGRSSRSSAIINHGLQFNRVDEDAETTNSPVTNFNSNMDTNKALRFKKCITNGHKLLRQDAYDKCVYYLGIVHINIKCQACSVFSVRALVDRKAKLLMKDILQPSAASSSSSRSKTPERKEKERPKERNHLELEGQGPLRACHRALSTMLQIVAALHGIVSFLLSFAQLGACTTTYCSNKTNLLSADWGGLQGIGAELHEIQKQIDSLKNPRSPSEVISLLNLRREVLFLQFDAAVRHLIREAFLSTGNIQAYLCVTDHMYHALPALSNSLVPSAFGSQLSVPQPLNPCSHKAFLICPWRTFLATSGLFPVIISEADTTEYNMQLCLCGLNERDRKAVNGALIGVSLLMEDVLQGKHGFVCFQLENEEEQKLFKEIQKDLPQHAASDTKLLQQSCMSSTTVMTLHQDPIKSYTILRSFLILWKQLEVFKETWGRLKLRVEDINTVALYKQFAKLYRTEILFPTMKVISRQLGKEDEYEGLISDSQTVPAPKGASEVDIKSRQLQKILESLECHMITEVQKKVTKEMTLVISERARQDSGLPTELWKHAVMKENFSAVRPQIVENVVQKLMEQSHDTGDEVCFKREHLQKCLTSLACDVMQRERSNYETYSMFYENVLRHEHQLLYQKEQEVRSVERNQNHSEGCFVQAADLSHDMIVEITALRARLSDLEEEKQNLKQTLRKEVQNEYEMLVRNLFLACFTLKAKLDEYHITVNKHMYEMIGEVRQEAVESIISLKKRIGSTKDDEALKGNLVKYEQMQALRDENNQLEQLICKQKILSWWKQNAKEGKLHIQMRALEQEAIKNKKDYVTVKMIVEEEVTLLRQELAAVRKALANSQADYEKMKQELDKQKQLLKEFEHRVSQEARSRQQLDNVKMATMERVFEDMEEKEHQLRALTDEHEKQSKMSHFQQTKIEKEIRQIKHQLSHERCLKLDAFQRVDELQTQIYDFEASLLLRNSLPGSKKSVSHRCHSASSFHGASLAYLAAKIIPRGLRVYVEPGLGNNDEQFMLKWRAIQATASSMFLQMLVEHYEKQLPDLIAKLEQCFECTQEYVNTLDYQNLYTQFVTDTEKYDKELCKRKMHKYQRDVSDFNKATVYTWKKQKRGVRFMEDKQIPRPKRKRVKSMLRRHDTPSSASEYSSSLSNTDMEPEMSEVQDLPSPASKRYKTPLEGQAANIVDEAVRKIFQDNLLQQ